MKYNPHFKEARDLFEQCGIDSVWSKGEVLAKTYIKHAHQALQSLVESTNATGWLYP